MILKSFSKINLSLSVNKKLKNGLHDIQSYFCIINLFDQIKIEKNKGQKDIIKFTGKFAKYVDKKRNSISDTLSILREYKIITGYYFIKINKKIPVYAGLAGGTSNAACLIKHFIKKKYKKNLLNILSKRIGSDLRLFFYNQGFLRNLKKISGFKTKYSLFFLLIYPNIKSSTKHAYSQIKKYSPKLKNRFNKVDNKTKFTRFLMNTQNDLQSVLENKHPIIRKLIAEIEQKKGCYFSRMTGSGSVCYGIFENKKTATMALKVIKSKYPKFWFSLAKTI